MRRANAIPTRPTGTARGCVTVELAVLQSPFFWIKAILVGLVFIAFKTKKHYWSKIFPDNYFTGEEFLGLKAKISEYVEMAFRRITDFSRAPMY